MGAPIPRTDRNSRFKYANIYEAQPCVSSAFLLVADGSLRSLSLSQVKEDTVCFTNAYSDTRKYSNARKNLL